MTKLSTDELLTIAENLSKMTPTSERGAKLLAYSQDFCRKAIDNDGIVSGLSFSCSDEYEESCILLDFAEAFSPHHYALGITVPGKTTVTFT